MARSSVGFSGIPFLVGLVAFPALMYAGSYVAEHFAEKMVTLPEGIEDKVGASKGYDGIWDAFKIGDKTLLTPEEQTTYEHVMKARQAIPAGVATVGAAALSFLPGPQKPAFAALSGAALSSVLLTFVA